jgi:endoglucanase
VTLRSALAAVALLASPANAAEPLPVGACINMGNHLEPERESGWGGKRIEAADFGRIRTAGFKTVRIPVRWSNKTESGPGQRSIRPGWRGWPKWSIKRSRPIST